MKKISAIAAAALLTAALLCGCNASDGKIDDGRNGGYFATESMSSRTASRRNESMNSSRMNDTHTDKGVIHEAASMVGDVGEDIAEGAGNMVSAAASNVNDAFDGTDSDNMDNM